MYKHTGFDSSLIASHVYKHTRFDGSIHAKVSIKTYKIWQFYPCQSQCQYHITTWYILTLAVKPEKKKMVAGGLEVHGYAAKSDTWQANGTHILTLKISLLDCVLTLSNTNRSRNSTEQTHSKGHWSRPKGQSGSKADHQHQSVGVSTPVTGDRDFHAPLSGVDPGAPDYLPLSQAYSPVTFTSRLTES